MATRGHAAHAGRALRSAPGGRDLQNRARIADLAARYIVEHGLTDWSVAKRKAARQLMLEASCALPGDDEIEAALIAHHALFGGEAHAASLRNQRAEALRWMQDLKPFDPALTGGVAAGWASEHSDIRIEVVADDAKAVELVLINRGIAYRAGPASGHEAAELYVDTPAGGIRLIVRTPAMARQRPRRDRQGREEIRLDAAALA
ncbi:MAG: hypothetical protein ACM3QY_01535, partial [Candidatus Levyibacteriota bacterium]